MKITNTPEVAAQHATSHASGGTDILDHGLLQGLGDDDHTQYQKESEKSAANGYPSLDGSALVPKGELPSDTVFLATAQTLTNKTLNDPSNTIHSDGLHSVIRNESGGTMAVGAIIYPSGFNVGLDVTLISLADANVPAAMPASGIVVEADIANNATGVALVQGTLAGLDTSAWSVGTQLYVSTTAGALTSTKPTGVADEIQAVATVIRSNASNGKLLVHISGHSHEYPNSVLPAAQVPVATESAVGGLEVATVAEVAARASDVKIITPAKLPVAGLSVSGIITYIAQTIYGAKTLTGNTRIGSVGTPAVVLHVAYDDVPALSVPAWFTFLMESTSNPVIAVATTDAGNSYVGFTSPSTNAGFGAFLKWNYDAGLFTIGSAVAGADVILLSGNQVEAMRITSGGIISTGGLAVPDGVAGSLHVWTGTAGAVTASGNADDLIVEGGSYGGISLLNAAAGEGAIYFGSPTSQQDGRIQYNHGSRFMKFITATNEGMRIDSAGKVGIGTNAPGYILDVYHASEKVNSQNGYLTNGADFGEYFESLGGNKIPFGVSVVLQGDKIRPASVGETPIGVVSATCSYVGNNGGSEWPEKYLRDEMGEVAIEDYTETVTEERQAMDEVDLYDSAPVMGAGGKKGGMFEQEKRTAGKVIGKHKIPRTVEKTTTESVVELVNGKYIKREVTKTITEPVMENYEEIKTGKRAVINPAFDPSKGTYIKREERDEWNVVGLLGQIRILKRQPVNPRWTLLKDINDNVGLWLVQ